MVGLIEGVNFAKLMVEAATKGDQKTWLSLLASGMSIASALFDVATIPIKNLPNFGSESWTYQLMKGWGSVLGGGASFIGAYLDWQDARESSKNGYWLLSALYVLKMNAGVASGVLTLALAFTHSASLVSRLTGRAVSGAIIEKAGTRVAAVIGMRIIGMTAGGLLTLIIFGASVIIWQATPDALQKWIDHSSLGKERRHAGFKNLSEQEEALEQALVKMGMKNE